MRVSRIRSLRLVSGAAIALGMAATATAGAWDCSALPSHFALKEALISAQMQSNGGFGLQRSGGARADVLGQVRELAVGVVVGQRGRLDGGEFLEQLRREVILLRLRCGRGRRERNGRVLWLRSRLCGGPRVLGVRRG